MSRIGRRPIPVPAGVDVTIDGNTVRVKGPRGELSRTLHSDVIVRREDGDILVERPSDEPRFRALHGLSRTLVANMIDGVTTGFTKTLEIQGVGYRAAMDGRTLVLNIGYSHQVRVVPPDGITFAVETPTRLTVSGIDKQQVGEQAAQIRRHRPPEPYKGKGIRYEGERIRRKAGKTGKAK